MKRFKIIKVKWYQVLSDNGIIAHKEWKKQRYINAWEEKILRVSSDGDVQRLELGWNCLNGNLVNGLQFIPNWVRDNNYRVVQFDEDPWKQFVNRYNYRQGKSSKNEG